MNKKLLVINKQDPTRTRYLDPRSVAVYMWGRRLSNYIFLIISTGSVITIDWTKDEGDVDQLQKTISTFFE
jgi:hypothetical protein